MTRALRVRRRGFRADTRRGDDVLILNPALTRRLAVGEVIDPRGLLRLPYLVTARVERRTAKHLYVRVAA